jgi:hypothetical protein
MNSEEREAQAKQRFILLSAMRLLSALLVMLGLAFISGKIMPGFEAVGYFFVIFGAAEFFIAPIFLKKMWAKKDGS